MEPKEIIYYTNKAHALMLLGPTEEAQNIYLNYRGKIIEGIKTWDQSITSDFAALRKAGIQDPLMYEIEANFAK